MAMPSRARLSRIRPAASGGAALGPCGAERAVQGGGAARAGDDPELHLREAEDGRLVCNAEVGGERELEAGAERQRVALKVGCGNAAIRS